MAAGRSAWVLNLDADLELAGGAGYTPRRSVREAMRSFVPLLARSLLGEDDVLVDEATAPMAARGLVGRAFCPTPRAVAMLRRAGATPEAHPPVEVLRRVNSRAFCSALGPMLPRAVFAIDPDAARAKLSEAPPAFALGGAWRVKRAFGMTGRGQRVVAPGAVSEADLAFVRTGLGEGGVQIEPNVAIAREYALHGMLGEDGSLALGELVAQRCDARGAWLSTDRMTPEDTSDAERAIADQLREQASRTAVALSREAYFGPFGIDAYTYRDELADLHVHPSSEINARYSMGFAVGFAVRRGGG
jgi:hypothetical protein